MVSKTRKNKNIFNSKKHLKNSTNRKRKNSTTKKMKNSKGNKKQY